MHWFGKSWDKEDVEFAPKRKVDNKDSKQRPHVIGAFHSQKMSIVAEYDSLTEWAFYSLLELEINVAQYYVQPLHIHVPYSDNNGNLKRWAHVPDVLVFRDGSPEDEETYAIELLPVAMKPYTRDGIRIDNRLYKLDRRIFNLIKMGYKSLLT